MGNNQVNYSRVSENEGIAGHTPVYRGPYLKDGEGFLDHLEEGITDLKKMYMKSFEIFESIDKFKIQNINYFVQKQKLYFCLI